MTPKQETITPKQELFAQGVAKHGNQSQAYRDAYPTSLKWPDSSVHSKASNLMANSKVLARVEELREEIKGDAIADAKERRVFWTAIMRDEGAEMKDRLKASEVLGKADGDFVDRKILQNPDGTGINQSRDDAIAELKAILSTAKART